MTDGENVVEVIALDDNGEVARLFAKATDPEEKRVATRMLGDWLAHQRTGQTVFLSPEFQAGA